MRKLLLNQVVKQMPLSFLYFLLGSSLGYTAAFVLFILNPNILQEIIQIWFKRITFGLNLGGKLWFILNNLVATLMIIASLLLIMTMVFRRRKFYLTRKFEKFEKHHKAVALYSLYIIPVGALMINGFLISLFLTFVLLNNGWDKFVLTFLLLLPHGINEIIALILSTSLALVYLKILKPYIIRGQWETSKKIGKELLFSQTTLLVIAFIIILVFFSGFIEGSLISLFR